jgi:hypothetical protein
MKRSDLTAGEIAEQLTHRGAAFIAYLLPNAVPDKKTKDAVRVGSASGEAGQSMVVNLSGAHAGTWIDWSVSDRSQDFIGLIRENRGLNLHEACEFACDWLGIPSDDGMRRKAPLPTPAPKPVVPPSPVVANSAETWASLQARMRRGSVSELGSLAQLRNLCAFAGLELATRAGQLWFADTFDAGREWPTWIVTDASRRCGQLRRTDGKPWESIGAKAKTLCAMKGDAGWPVGLAGTKAATDIALVEGGPDLLAAWHLIWWKGKHPETAPCAMLGASQSIHASAINLFAGKNVWIFPHYDQNDAGVIGARKWAKQLGPARPAAVHLFPFARHGVKDLNEFVAVHCRPTDEDDPLP